MHLTLDPQPRLYYSPMPLADGATFAGYTIVRLIGSGGMVTGMTRLQCWESIPRSNGRRLP